MGNFYVYQSIKKSKEMNLVLVIDVVAKSKIAMPVKDRFFIKTLEKILMNFDSNKIEKYDELVCAVTGMGSFLYARKKLDLDLKNRLAPLAKPSIEEPLILELKELPGHLRYMFLVKRTPS